MGPLLPALLAILSPLSWAGTACLDAYQKTEHEAKWEVSRPQWAKLCAEQGDAAKALALAKERFIKGCIENAMPALQAKDHAYDEVEQLCGEGVPGRAKITVAAAVPRPGPGNATASRLDTLGKQTSGLDNAVTGLIKKDSIAELYGEKAGLGVIGAVAGMGGGGKTGPLIAVQKGAGLDNKTGPPLDPIFTRSANIVTIQSRIVSDGVSKEAADRAKLTVAEMLREADPAVVQNLVDRKVYIYLIPKDKDMTDLAPFKNLKGKKTFDGRLWDKVRGVGDTDLGGGKGHAMAVAEETLLEDKKPGEGYPRNFVMVHEFGHMVQLHGLPTKAAAAAPQPGFWERVSRSFRLPKSAATDKDRAKALGRLAYETPDVPVSFSETMRLYRATLQKEGKSKLGAYAEANEREFFAEMTAAYFDVGYEAGKYNDLKLLMKERPELAQVMYRVYGPAPSMRGR